MTHKIIIPENHTSTIHTFVEVTTDTEPSHVQPTSSYTQIWPLKAKKTRVKSSGTRKKKSKSPSRQWYVACTIKVQRLILAFVDRISQILADSFENRFGPLTLERPRVRMRTTSTRIEAGV